MIIYKYEIPIEDKFEIEMPNLAKVLSFQLQGSNPGKPVIWVLCNHDLPLTKRKFALIGTGHEIENHFNYDVFDYIGTIQMLGGKVVYHLFDLYYAK